MSPEEKIKAASHLPQSFTITFLYKDGTERKVEAKSNFKTDEDGFMEWWDTDDVIHLANMDDVREIYWDKNHRILIDEAKRQEIEFQKNGKISPPKIVKP